MLGELVIFVLVLAVVIAVGGVVGILVSRRLTGWEERRETQEEEPRERGD